MRTSLLISPEDHAGSSELPQHADKLSRNAVDPLSSIAFLSTVPPQRCGLASFTADLISAVRDAAPGIDCQPVAMVENGGIECGSPLVIPAHENAAYHRAAMVLNAAGTSVLSIQHEFGIYGGPDGEMLLSMIDAVEAPIVVTLHTVLDRPSVNQRRVMDMMVRRSARVVVMTRHSAEIMQSVYGIGGDRLSVVPHGVPATLEDSRAACRTAFRVTGRPTMLTFGLLSPGKGIEHAVRSLPGLIRRWPDILYVVLGTTHPNVVRAQGETYRDGLVQLAQELGVAQNVRFVDRFVKVPELMQALTAADVYVTPYLNEAQSVSGTLSYSYGVGTPVVSTPYRHAVELLSNGRGVLVPFADPAAIANAVDQLLSNPDRLAAMRRAARLGSRHMLWPNVAHQYLEIFREAVAARPSVSR